MLNFLLCVYISTVDIHVFFIWFRHWSMDDVISFDVRKSFTDLVPPPNKFLPVASVGTNVK